MGVERFPASECSRRRRTRLERSTVRGVRQKGSNYRCCLPALAGFARPKSAPPDGAGTMEGFARNSMVRLDFFKTSRLQPEGLREDDLKVRPSDT